MKKILETKSLTAISIAVLTFVSYIPALQNEFVNWDDKQYVYDNPLIRAIDIKLFKSAFLGFYAANWHPLTWISHAIDYSIWGLNPFGHHLINNVLHSVNTFLVVVLVLRLIEAGGKHPSPSPSPPRGEGRSVSRFTLLAAATTGLLFGLHPLHVESVAWVAERKDLLCGLFFLLSILKYMSYRAYKTNTAYFLTLFFFTLALLSKPMAVSLPFVLLILDWYPFRRIQSVKTFWAVFVEKIPFVGLSLISLILTVLAQRVGDAIAPTDEVALSTRVMVASKSLIAYLWKMIMPTTLIPFYSYPKDVTIFSPEYFCSIIFIIAITGSCIFYMKRHRLALSVWGYYVITLLPVLGIVQIGGQSMADRYMYLPSIGPFLIIALLFAWAYKSVNSLKWMRMPRLFAGVVASCLFVTMTYLTLEQISKWKNSITLWSCVIENNPRGVILAYYNRGFAYYEKGLLDNALADFNMSIALNPFYYRGYNARGVIFKQQGRYKEALEDFDMAVRLAPSYYPGYQNRAGVFERLGIYDKAAEDFARAAELNKQN